MRACLQSQLLRNQCMLKHVIGQSLSMVLPTSVLKPFLLEVEEGRRIQPDPGTLPRWRFFGGVSMLCSRMEVDREGAGSKARYRMADASAQRNRDFEHIIVL